MPASRTPMTMYGDAVETRVRSARFRGEIRNETARCEKTNPICGDVLRLSVRVEGGVIAEASWMAQGCPPTLAAADLLVELIIGRTVADSRTLTETDLLDRLPGLPPTSRHAVNLALEALRGL